MTDRLGVEVLTSTPGEARLVMRGDVDIAADEVLAAAYAEAAATGAKRVVLDFGAVDYINSTGIALIVRMLAEARRDHREVIALGLSDHYREIFRITRLSDYLTIADATPAASVPEEADRRPTPPWPSPATARRRSCASTARSPAAASRRSWRPTRRRATPGRSSLTSASSST